MHYWEGANLLERAICSEERTARKEHKCCECKKTIKPGEKYSYVAGLWEDYHADFEFRARKTCLSCEEDWGEILYVFQENGYPADETVQVHGSLRQAVEEAFDEGLLSKSEPLVCKWLIGDEYERRIAAEQMAAKSAPLL